MKDEKMTTAEVTSASKRLQPVLRAVRPDVMEATHMKKEYEPHLELSLEALVEKYNRCVANLDEDKHCQSCRNQKKPKDQEPCASCYNELIGMPVNPTNWEKQSNDDPC